MLNRESMRKPIYQGLIEIIGWVILGAVTTGVLFDAISNAVALMNIRFAFIVTGVFFNLTSNFQSSIKFWQGQVEIVFK